ncbi:MAG: OmpA family protein [Colwellia sp.]
MKFITFLCVLFISACSVNVVEMTPEPTKQVFDLTDSEGDGIIKARDLCPESKFGVKVGNRGCSSNSVYTIRHRLDVNFDVNSYIVKDEYIPQIKKLADFMSEHSKINVLIEGHTSIRGSATYNKILSKNRAMAIKEILVNRYNIASQRVTTIGYGFEKLLLEGDDAFIHEQNRRIVAEITSDVSFTDMKWTIYSVDDEIE